MPRSNASSSDAPSRRTIVAPLAQEPMIDIATFYCGQQRLGLQRDDIVEAMDGTNLRPIPNAPAWHAGLLMYRETPLPVIDLGKLLNTGPGTDARNVIVVRAVETGQLFGLLVEELADIPEIAVSRILPGRRFECAWRGDSGPRGATGASGRTDAHADEHRAAADLRRRGRLQVIAADGVGDSAQSRGLSFSWRIKPP